MTTRMPISSVLAYSSVRIVTFGAMSRAIAIWEVSAKTAVPSVELVGHRDGDAEQPVRGAGGNVAFKKVLPCRSVPWLA